ncbi:hypothetical protein [Baekduia sp. Peel2402]|uniref:hypothetical protein n=1 Tax=Baekduia sp. Peel2402 TaxID=3458296 RepID=UPI00403ED8CD
MSKIARRAVLVAAALSLLAALSSTASAVTWHNTGNTAYTASIGPGTLSASGTSYVCSSGTMTATVTSTPFVGAIWAGETGTATFTGGPCGSVNIDCSFKVTAYAWTNIVPAVTHAIVDTTCGAYTGGTKVCQIVGTINSIATNPTGATAGTVTSQTGPGLFVTDATPGSCPLGNGVAADLTVMKATITNGSGGGGNLGPIITRTA